LNKKKSHQLAFNQVVIDFKGVIDVSDPIHLIVYVYLLKWSARFFTITFLLPTLSFIADLPLSFACANSFYITNASYTSIRMACSLILQLPGTTSGL
jgi:hypothetical protein